MFTVPEAVDTERMAEVSVMEPVLTFPRTRKSRTKTLLAEPI
jgi:hypothetical protein